MPTPDRGMELRCPWAFGPRSLTFSIPSRGAFGCFFGRFFECSISDRVSGF